MPEDYARYDDQLLPLAEEIGDGSAGQLVDAARDRLGLDHFTVARWMWSAHARGLLVEGDPHYSTFRFVGRPQRQARNIEPPSPNLEPRCSFCEKTKDEVADLVCSSGACICDECVTLCREIIDEKRERTNR